MKKKYDYLIVGSGLYGATFAYIAGQKGKKCLVIDKRQQIGGNLFMLNVNGIDIHYYGPHIFHTDDEEVWNFISNIVEMRDYTLSPMGKYCYEYYHLPFNLTTIIELFGLSDSESLKKWHDEIDEAKNKIGKPKNLYEEAICLVGKTMFEKLIRGYTEKQWGRKCEDLPTGIISRIPVRETRENSYYNDKYSALPVNGYNDLINKLLEKADKWINTDFFDNPIDTWYNLADKIVFTGRIDEFYSYCFGSLEYRSLHFEHKIYNQIFKQPCAVLNRNDKFTKFTRSIEHKRFSDDNDKNIYNHFTVVTEEYPSLIGEPYYPINDEKNNELFKQYKELANKEENVIFGGRLADYKYYDMDDIIRQVLNIKDKI